MREWIGSQATTCQRNLTLPHSEVLQELSLTYLRDMFPDATARRYVRQGIPFAQRHQIGGAERELLIPADRAGRFERSGNDAKTTLLCRSEVVHHQWLLCLPRHSRHGGCQADWARPERLGTQEHGPVGFRASAPLRAAVRRARPLRRSTASPPFYRQQLAAQSRIGFIYQKLKEPRSFDYYETRNKKYTERLRMPQFSLTVPEREAIITFVLGLVADPPSPKYVYAPDAHTKALMAGNEVMTKYSCRGCHIVEPEKWDLAFPPDYYGPQTTQPTYPFVAARFSSQRAGSIAGPGLSGPSSGASGRDAGRQR